MDHNMDVLLKNNNKKASPPPVTITRVAPLRKLYGLTLIASFVVIVATCVYTSGRFSGTMTPSEMQLPDHLPASHPEVLQALRSTFLLPPSKLPYNLSKDPDYLATSHADTWGIIHYHLSRLFSGERGGFFVEAGALDGQQLSNSLWLEQELGWTGLLVEPDPYSFLHLGHKHRKAWTSNACLSSDAFTRRSVHVALKPRPGYRNNYPWFMRGSSHELGVKLATKSAEEVETLQYYLNRGEESYMVTYCFPLHSYLLALNITKVDLLSLDTQGSEIEIIKSIPWEEVEVRVVVMEVADRTHYQSDLVEYMRGKGYFLVGRFMDYIFVREGDSAHTRLLSHKDWQLVVHV
ncbi:hypothetical protein Pcinc_041956 [Petrolisthes cinctipes]|uniref:Methyltransferase FkbM domain-containing protein n=1 Tax=Petrolisthes cinctipes TaxID=88211 RepID=A0AAE1BJ62_PETCI|nr:hypothetical protein Pcinc_041956 [Petrolisthes cinctipes]